MQRNEQTLPPSLTCPRCGAKVIPQSSAQSPDDQTRTTKLVCENGHEMQLFTKAKSPR